MDKKIRSAIIWGSFTIFVIAFFIFGLEYIFPAERLAMHNHFILSMDIGGRNATIPKDIGVVEELYKDHSLDKFGSGGLAPLHTHDTKGLVHVEAKQKHEFRFGDFMKIWGIENTYSEIILYKVDGNTSKKEIIDDYKNYVLEDNDILHISVK